MASVESTADGRITKFGCTETGIARYTTQARTMLDQTRRFVSGATQRLRQGKGHCFLAPHDLADPFDTQ